MTHEPPRGATPRLRFPEFRDTPGWEEKPLSAMCRVTQGGTPDTNVSKFWGGVVQWLTPAEMGKSDSRYISKTVRTITEDGLRNCSSELLPVNSVIISTRAPIGHLAINQEPMAINQGCRGLVPNSENDTQFVYYSLEKLKSQLNDLGAGNTFKELSGTVLKRFSLFTPQLGEQRRIADCLASLDELIAAQGQKLDALKAHKKGLLQQLFPAEGETVPRLRFPEFRDAGEWEEKNITSIAKTSIGLVTTMTTSYSDNGVPLIRNSDIQPNKIRKEKLIYLLDSFADKYSNKKLKEGDIVTVHTGDIGVSAVIDNALNGCLGFATLNTRLITTNILPQYVCWYYNTERYINFAISMATGDGRNNFNLKDFDKSVIPIPSFLEQQRIADCLASLDDLIAAQGQRLAALKAHKSGLMQQLFPVVEP